MKDKLYLGSGIWTKTGWLNHYTSKSIWYNNITKNNITKNKGNLDNISNFKFDIDLDLTEGKKIPLKDYSLKTVYTSHMIEHLKEYSVMQKNHGIFT